MGVEGAASQVTVPTTVNNWTWRVTKTTEAMGVDVVEHAVDGVKPATLKPNTPLQASALMLLCSVICVDTDIKVLL